MDPEIYLFTSFFPQWIKIVAALLTSFLITYFSIPSIVKIARHKKLFDIPNERTSHNNEVPVLGGISIFTGISVAMVLFSSPAQSGEILYLLGGLIILLFLGLKDDVMMIDPKKKFAGQILAAVIVVILGNIRIINFHSVFGIESVSFLPGVLITIFLFLTLINGFNLIDGVDGLSSGTGIISGLFFGIWFAITGHLTYAVTGFSIAGALAAYSRFNIFSTRNKIFMGDSGSMLTGMTLSFLAVRFLELSGNPESAYHIEYAPALAFAILILPLFDTLRIFTLRILNGRSPFRADKGHIHHVLLCYGLSHLKVTLYLLSSSIIFPLLILLIQPAGNLPAIVIMVVISAAVMFILRRILKIRGIPTLNGR